MSRAGLVAIAALAAGALPLAGGLRDVRSGTAREDGRFLILDEDNDHVAFAADERRA